MDTVEEIEAEIAIVSAAITALMQGGQQYMIQTGASMRQFMAADIDKLRDYRNELKAQLRSLEGLDGLTIGAGW